MNLTFIGPNLPRPLCDKGTIHVHAAGCRDIDTRYPKRRDPDYTCDVDTVEDAVELMYPPDCFLYDPDNDEERAPFDGDVFFAPCTRSLPSRKGALR